MRSRAWRRNTAASLHSLVTCVVCFLIFLMVYIPSGLHPTADIHTTQGRTTKQPHDLVTVLAHSVKEDQVKVAPWWDGGGGCRCAGEVCLPHAYNISEAAPSVDWDGVGGTCGRRAWAAGDGQRVVTLSLYGDNPEYWVGLHDILLQVKRLYPGWVVRLYTDPRGRGSVLCPLLRDHTHLYVCDITGLPPPLGDLSLVNGMMWRIAPLGDPQVAGMMVRDTDSKIIRRETEAVNAWWSTGQMFHIMRDHPKHDFPILGGLWGARWDHGGGGGEGAAREEVEEEEEEEVVVDARQLAAFRDDMLRRALKGRGYGDDQNILAEVLWPAMQGRVVTHDSYWCQEYENDTLPWPTQRVDGRFVGYRRFKKKFEDEKIPDKCPSRCRPPGHHDWLYC
ncbi:uncharacterized protein [Panulirus ornatus]|uniref:uncharacterized protein isoform X2 n=1 Tax=Panulirus ornatus TaxID=150431 RepID=UPI003A845F27